MLPINRSCHSLKILHLLRSHFALFNNSFPILLHEVATNEEILLDNEMVLSTPINAGIYFAAIKYAEEKYQPLLDLRFIPVEIFPEKLFLPKSMPFVIDQIDSFVKALSNTIEFMKEYEKSKVFFRKDDLSPTRSISQISTVKRTNRTKSTVTQTLSSPLSALSIIPIAGNQEIDIRKYIVTDPQRMKKDSLAFSVRILNPNEQISYPRVIHSTTPFFSMMEENNHFNENDLVLFKQHLTSSFPLELKNCIHQLAIEQKLESRELHDLFIQLDQRINQNEFHLHQTPTIIHNFLKAASNNQEKIIEFNLSNLMRILLRIDQLGKWNQLEKEKVQICNERIHHLARLGILHQQTKMLKKLSQLDLFANEPSSHAFSRFIHEDLQRILPKHIPINALGLKEIIHQLQINIDRLGVIPTLLLIDNLQQINQSGVLLTLNKYPQLKRYLSQFIEHLQTDRCVGVYLQRLVEQMNNSLQMNTMKKSLLTNQINSLLQQAKLESRIESSNKKNTYEELVSILMNLACQGELNAFTNIISHSWKINEHDQSNIFDINRNNLQSLILFLQEQSSTISSSSSPLPYQYVHDFIQYLHHCAQLGILDESRLFHLFTLLHKAKDQDTITSQTFKTIREQMQTLNYLDAYPHLPLTEFDRFLDDMIVRGDLTPGQGWFILDRLIDLCRTEPITNFDIKTLLTNLQLDHHRQQSIYPKLIDSLELLAESYSKSLAELHSLERDLQKLVLSNNIKRIPEEVRKRLNEILSFCKIFRNDRFLVEQLFGETMNYKFYNRMKDILKTKNLINRKQSLTAIVQIHKHFTQISRLNRQSFLSDQQLDMVIQCIRSRCSNQEKFIEERIKNMIKLGYLQEKSFAEYLTKEFLSNVSTAWSAEKCREVLTKLQSWPLTIDLNHPETRLIIKYLIQLENHDQIDTGSLIEIQNRLNQLARFGQWTSPQVTHVIERILRNPGKKSAVDREGFQSIQSLRLMLNDLVYAIKLQFSIEKLAFEHRISDQLNYRYRSFLYRILQNELSIDELSRYRGQFEHLYRIKQFDIEEMKRFINVLPEGFNQFFPLTLTDRLFEQLKWDGKTGENSMRDQLLKFERSGVLSRDTFEEIYNNLSRTSDISRLGLEDKKGNQLLDDLFNKINDLLDDGSIELSQAIEVKEQLHLLEAMLDRTDLSAVIALESRLFNASNEHEFQRICKELKTHLYQEQFRLSKAQDLISKWQLNEEKGNVNDKQILKLLHELANLNRLHTSSALSVFNRYIDMKQKTHRQLIKDLQRLKILAMIDKQAIECVRSVEVRLSKIDHEKRLNQLLMTHLENRLNEIFTTVSHSFDPSFRIDICKKLSELLEIYVKANSNEDALEQLSTSFEAYITQIKQGQIRSSKVRYRYSSLDTLPKISPSLQSLQSIS